MTTIKPAAIAAGLLLVAAPLALADGPSEESKWGRCQAFFASEQGNESSNGTVHNQTPFENLSEDDCNDEEPPYSGTPAEDHAGDHPGKQGGDASDDAEDNAPDNPGDGAGDNAPGGPGDTPASNYIPDGTPTGPGDTPADSYTPDDPRDNGGDDGKDNAPDHPGAFVTLP